MDCNSGEVKQLERGSDLELIEGFGCGGTYKVSIIRNRKTGIPIAIRQVDIVDGKEVECQASDLKKYKMQIPKGFQNTDLDVLKLRDGHTGDFVGDVDIAQDLDIFPGIPVTVPKRDVSKVQSMIESLNDLEEKEKETMKKSIEDMKKNEEPELLSMNQVAQTLEMILSPTQEIIPPKFYNNIDEKLEFGIARVVGDKIPHLQKLLDDLFITQIDSTKYLLQSEIKISQTKSLKLEHQLHATSEEEAKKIGRVLKRKIENAILKAWLGCWSMANKKRKFTFTCHLTEIMNECHPDRDKEVYFNSSEKKEFYEHLRMLENTKLSYTNTFKVKGKEKYESYEIRMLEIHKHSGDKDETPINITMTVFNSAAFQYGKLAFVAFGVKHKTLGLHADDVFLATLFQIRKNQAMNLDVISIDRDTLIERAGLSKTNKSHKSHANKLFLNTLKRYHDAGILLSIPQKIEDTVFLKIR
jgi:hypothetical protein